MVSPKLLGALSYRSCWARRGEKHGARPDLYTQPGFAFGGVPLVIFLGDFMQLAPLQNGGRKSLLKQPELPKLNKPKRRLGPRAKAFDDGFAEELNGYDMFWNCLTHVMFLEGTHRFVDRSKKPPVPCPIFSQSSEQKPAEGLFEYMRDPRGRKLPQHLRRALQRMQCRPGDPRLREPRRKEGYEMAIVWEGVSRLMHTELFGKRRQQGRWSCIIRRWMSAGRRGWSGRIIDVRCRWSI